MISASLLQARHVLARREFSSSSSSRKFTRQAGWWWGCSEIITRKQQQPSSSCGATTTTNLCHHQQQHQRCYFSAEPSMVAAQVDKPLLPGIGKGKTSTGLVRVRFFAVIFTQVCKLALPIDPYHLINLIITPCRLDSPSTTTPYPK